MKLILSFTLAAWLSYLFRPLLLGLLHAAKIVLFGKNARRIRRDRKRAADVIAVLRLAKEHDHSAPSLAQELRAMACRDRS